MQYMDQTHILNGEALLEPFRQLGLEGVFFAWKEALAFGPLPDKTPLDDLLPLRANHLNQAYNIPKSESLKTWEYQLKMLNKASEAGEVVLWFEDDLFCQINLMFIINYLAKGGNRTRLAVVRLPVDGTGDVGVLETAFKNRALMTWREIKHVQKAYKAYTSANPSEIENFIHADTAVADLQHALQLHLRRFPSTQSGLGHLERQILSFVAGGIDEFEPVFNMMRELEPDYGLGDWQVWYLLQQLSARPEPAIHIEGVDGSPAFSPETFRRAVFKVTGFGEKVLSGDADYLARNPPNAWLGGVNLAKDSLWRWDEMSHRLIRFIPE
jgi:hypothetical protein